MTFRLLLLISALCSPCFSNAQELDCGDPEFIGGKEALMSYIHNNLSIPDSCISNTNSTKLNVKLVIDGAGNVSHVELYKAEFLRAECVQEIENIFYSMPKWIPGKSNGKTANKIIYLPVTLEVQ